MNTSSKALFAVAAVLFSLSSYAQVPTITKIWETDTTVTTPESVLYLKGSNQILVSCINGAPSPSNQSSFVARINLKGVVLPPALSTGLHGTKGMGVIGKKLYITEMTAVAEINLETGVLIQRFNIPGAVFLNDITTDQKTKTVYVTDSRSNKVWKIKGKEITLLIDGKGLKNPNGLLWHKEKLFIGNGDGNLFTYNAVTQSLEKYAEGMGAIDGIAADDRGGFFLSEWQGKIWYVDAAKKPTLLLDTVKENIKTADIDYIISKKLLLVPTFFGNKVLAFKVKY